MPTKIVDKSRSKLGDGWVATFDIVIDGDYVAGGFDLTPSSLGFYDINVALPAPSGGLIFAYDHSEGKLKAYSPTAISVAAGGTAGADTYLVENSGEIAISGSGSAFDFNAVASELAAGVTLDLTVRMVVVGI